MLVLVVQLHAVTSHCLLSVTATVHLLGTAAVKGCVSAALQYLI
jgi:hypothetical protein